jgi:hypothetical protein
VRPPFVPSLEKNRKNSVFDEFSCGGNDDCSDGACDGDNGRVMVVMVG